MKKGECNMINNYNYQSKANIQCLTGDIEYRDRQKGFFEIVAMFEKENIRWGLACSMNLFIRGIVDEFHDIDLLVEGQDIPKVRKIMEENGGVLVATGGNGYCESKEYMNFQFGRIDVDIISGFRIVTFGTQFLYEFSSDEIEYIKIDNFKIPLISMEALYILYSMMEGWQPRRRYKRRLIEEFLLQEDLVFPKILEQVVRDEALPTWIRENVEVILSSNK